MGQLQSIDLRDDSELLGEQHRVLDRLHAISDAGSSSAWAADAELELLMLQYEHVSWQRAAV